MAKAIKVPLLPQTSVPQGESPLDFAFGLLQSATEYSIIGKDLNGTVQLWNEGARRLYGYEPDEIVGRSSEILHVPEDVASGKPREILDVAAREGKWEGTIERLRKDGRRFPARVVVTPRKAADGSIVGFLLMSKDLSNELRYVHDHRRSRMFDSAIVSNPTAAMEFITNILQSSTEYSVVGKDMEGKILLWNEGARRLYGYDPEEVVGKANAEILHVPEDIAAGRPRQIMEAALKEELEIAHALEDTCSLGRKLIGARYMLAVVRKDEMAPTSVTGAAGFEASEVDAFAAFPPRSGRMAELYESCPFLRLSGLTGDAVSYGLPPAFPRVSSLLAVPIHIGGRAVGWICAAEKVGLNAFGAVDTEVGLAISSVLGRVLTCISMSDDLRRRTRELEAEVYSHLATEAALRQSERRLRDLTEGISDWIWETGPDLTFTYFSGGTRADTALERQRHLGKRREQGAAEPTDTPAWKQHLDDLAARRPFRDFTYRIWDPNGNIRTVRTSGQPMFDESGAFRGYHGIAVDITAQTALEERQAELERRALQSAHLESLGTFAGGIAHDINNLLIPIVALGNNVLGELGPSDPHHEELQRIVDAGDAIAALVRQVLTFCRSDVQPLRPMRIADVLEKSSRLLRSTLPRNIKFTLELDPATGAIAGDETAILQVALNLCMNAADAIGDKSGHVSLSLARVPMEAADMAHPSPTGQYARLSVQDDGCGMDQATQDRIFEPFFTTKAVGKGTGIGMSVVHGIVTDHQGTITIESRPGKGTRFDIYFPLIASEGAA